MDIYQLTKALEELRTLKTSELVDMLAERTAHLTKLFAEKIIGKEYEKCKQEIIAIQTEIEERKEKA